MLTIKKIKSNNEADVIEADNYKMTINAKMTQNMVDIIARAGACKADDYIGYYKDQPYNRGRISEILNLSTNSIVKAFTSGVLYLVNTTEDRMGGAPIISPYSPCQGVVGAVDLDGIVYSGTDIIRGSVNIGETTYSVNSNSDKYTGRMVIDFPTNAANGSFDKVIIGSHSRFISNVYEGHQDFKYTNFIPKIIDYWGLFNVQPSIGSPTSTTGFGGLNEYNCYAAKDDIIFVKPTYSSNTSHNNVKKAMMIKKGKGAFEVDVEKLVTVSDYSYTTIYCIGGKFYLYYSHATAGSGTTFPNNAFYEMIISDNNSITLGGKLTVNEVLNFDSILESKTSYFHIYNAVDFENVTACLFKTNTNSSSYTFKIAFFDKITKEPVKTYTIGKSTNDLNPAEWYLNIKQSAVFYGEDGKKSLVIGGFIFDYNLEFLGKDIRFPSNNYTTKLITDGNKNYMVQSNTCPLLADRSGNSSYHGSAVKKLEIYETETRDNPCIIINLEEPVNKNNTETLKLIFDYDITIE